MRERQAWGKAQVGKYIKRGEQVGKIIECIGLTVSPCMCVPTFKVVWAYGNEEEIFQDYQIMENENEL